MPLRILPSLAAVVLAFLALAAPAAAQPRVSLAAAADVATSTASPPLTWDVHVDPEAPPADGTPTTTLSGARQLVLTTGRGFTSHLDAFGNCPRELLRDRGLSACPASAVLGTGEIDFDTASDLGVPVSGSTQDLRLVRTGTHTVAAYAQTTSPAGTILVPGKITEGDDGVTLTFDMRTMLRISGVPVVVRHVLFSFSSVGRGTIRVGGTAGPGDHHKACRGLGGGARGRCLARAREIAYRLNPATRPTGRAPVRLFQATSCARGNWTFGTEVSLTSGDVGKASAAVPCTATASAARLSARARPRAARARGPRILPIGTLATGAKAFLVRTPLGGWGIRVTGAGRAGVDQQRPVLLESTPSVDSPIDSFAVPYSSIRAIRGGVVATAQVRITSYVAVSVRDEWRVRGATLTLSRHARVQGDAAGGFATGVRLRVAQPVSRGATDEFLPGQIYRGTGGIVANAIGGRDTFPPFGRGLARIREDRLSAPLWGFRFPDNTSLTLYDPAPRGQTTAADNADRQLIPLIDRRFTFGSLEAVQPGNRLDVGFWYPGSEGPSTYTGGGYAPILVSGFRRRYHGLRHWVGQRYRVSVRFGRGEGHFGFERAAWRAVWGVLRPRVHPVDVDRARRAMIDMVLARVQSAHGRTAIPTWWNALLGVPATPPGTGPALMGFIGRNTDVASLLLLDSVLHPGAESARERAVAGQILDSFTLLPMSPPAGEGFELIDDDPAFYPRRGITYTRALTDGATAALRAALLVKSRGLTGVTTPDSPEAALARAAGRPPQGPDGWIAWARELGDFLLRNQAADGSIPRAFHAGTGAVADASPVTSAQPVEMLLLLAQATGDQRYRSAAFRAGEASWRFATRDGAFSGSTTDAPTPGSRRPVVDKESGSLALRAYLALYGASGSRKWLNRAEVAGTFLESWIRVWDVPMPIGVPGSDLAWKPRVPTTGVQGITTGNSYVDQYSAGDVDAFAELSKAARDPHWFTVARILLHDTKAMLALPGRTYDLAGPGWQQEAWNMGTPRGTSNRRNWLPWITAAQLGGILDAQQLDAGLFRRLAARR